MGGVVKGIKDAVGDTVKDVGSVGNGKVKSADVIPPEIDKVTDLLGGSKGEAAALAKALESLGKQSEGAQKKAADILKGLDAASKAVAKADFGLDPKKPDHKKAIADARKTLLSALDDARTQVDDTVKPLASLDKTVATFNKSGLA